MPRCKNQYTWHRIHRHIDATKADQNCLHRRGYFCSLWYDNSPCGTFFTTRDNMATLLLRTLYSNCSPYFASTFHLFLHNNCITSTGYRSTCHDTYGMTSRYRLIPYDTSADDTIDDIGITIRIIC